MNSNQIINSFHFRYPHLLTANLINKVSNLEESGTSATTPATRTYIAELRAEFHSRSRERLEKLTNGVNPANYAGSQSTPSSGITIVKVGGSTINGTTAGNSRSELNILSGLTVQGGREVQQRSGNITGAGSRSELNAHHRLSAIPGSTNQKATGLFLNGQRADIPGASSYQPSPYLMTGTTNIDQRNLAVITVGYLIIALHGDCVNMKRTKNCWFYYKCVFITEYSAK